MKVHYVSLTLSLNLCVNSKVFRLFMKFYPKSDENDPACIFLFEPTVTFVSHRVNVHLSH